MLRLLYAVSQKCNVQKKAYRTDAESVPMVKEYATGAASLPEASDVSFPPPLRQKLSPADVPLYIRPVQMQFTSRARRYFKSNFSTAFTAHIPVSRLVYLVVFIVLFFLFLFVSHDDLRHELSALYYHGNVLDDSGPRLPKKIKAASHRRRLAAQGQAKEIPQEPAATGVLTEAKESEGSGRPTCGADILSRRRRSLRKYLSVSCRCMSAW